MVEILHWCSSEAQGHHHLNEKNWFYNCPIIGNNMNDMFCITFFKFESRINFWTEKCQEEIQIVDEQCICHYVEPLKAKKFCNVRLLGFEPEELWPSKQNIGSRQWQLSKVTYKKINENISYPSNRSVGCQPVEIILIFLKMKRNYKWMRHKKYNADVREEFRTDARLVSNVVAQLHLLARIMSCLFFLYYERKILICYKSLNLIARC